MRTFAVALLVAAVVAAALTPLVRVLALRLGAVSHPGGRHIHERSVPRLGGLALYASVLAPLVGLFFVEAAVARTFTADLRKVFGLFAGSTLIVLVGAYDDVRGMRALHKLGAQVLVATLAYSCGFRIDAVELPFLGTLSMGALGLPLTVLWIVGIVNAVNLIDGLDGLAGGVAFFAAFTNFVVAVLTGAQLAALFSAAMMGAVLGFLFHNFNPARIFMGDSGSYFLGYVLALTSLSGVPRASAAVALLVPILALGVPIFDVLFSMVRRFLERRPIFSPDRGHIHHRLLDAGITHRRAVMILYAVCAVLAGSAIVAHLGRAWQVGVALLVASTALIVLVRLAGLFGHVSQVRRSRRARERAFDALRISVPIFLSKVHPDSEEAELSSELERFARAAEIEWCEVVRPSSGMVVWRYHAEAANKSEPLAELVLPLDVDAQLDFSLSVAWRSADADVAPELETLYRLVADRVASALPERWSAPAAASLPTPNPTRLRACVGDTVGQRA